MDRQRTIYLATGDSSAGCLKQLLGGAAPVFALPDELVDLPLPAVGDPRDFFPARVRLGEPEAWQRQQWLTEADAKWRALLERCAQDDERICLCVDPNPQAQLQMLQLIDALKCLAVPRQRVLVSHAAQTLGEQAPSSVGSLGFVPLDAAQQLLASRLWRAFTGPTPQAFAALVEEAGPLPHLQAAMLALLDELPGLADGLSATQRLLLAAVVRLEERGRTIAVIAEASRASILGYWAVGRQLQALAPALHGLVIANFDVARHDDNARFRGFRESRLSLSPLGHALRRGTEDLARHVTIRRGWGGTWLTNDKLWRWDPALRRVCDAESA